MAAPVGNQGQRGYKPNYLDDSLSCQHGVVVVQVGFKADPHAGSNA